MKFEITEITVQEYFRSCAVQYLWAKVCRGPSCDTQGGTIKQNPPSDGINIRGVFTVRWDDNSAVQEICAKTSSKDVKPFDVRDKRLEGTEAEQFKVCWISLLFG